MRVSIDGADFADDVQLAYADPQWHRTPAGQEQERPLKELLEQIGLPSADALEGAEVRAEEVGWAGETAHRYAVPQEVAAAAMGQGDSTLLHSFTVDDDGGLLALTVDDGRSLRQYALSDWNEIDPAEAPEEVAE